MLLWKDEIKNNSDTWIKSGIMLYLYAILLFFNSILIYIKQYFWMRKLEKVSLFNVINKKKTNVIIIRGISKTDNKNLLEVLHYTKACELISNDLDNNQSRIPIYIDLSKWQKGTPLEDFITESYRDYNEDGKYLFLFNDLDSAIKKDSDFLEEKLVEFIRDNFENNKFVITSDFSVGNISIDKKNKKAYIKPFVRRDLWLTYWKYFLFFLSIIFFIIGIIIYQFREAIHYYFVATCPKDKIGIYVAILENDIVNRNQKELIDELKKDLDKNMFFIENLGISIKGRDEKEKELYAKKMGRKKNADLLLFGSCEKIDNKEVIKWIAVFPKSTYLYLDISFGRELKNFIVRWEYLVEKKSEGFLQIEKITEYLKVLRLYSKGEYIDAYNNAKNFINDSNFPVKKEYLYTFLGDCQENSANHKKEYLHIYPEIESENLKNHENAIKEYEKALSYNNTYIPALFGMSSTFISLKNYVDAEFYCNSALNIYPDDIDVLDYSAVIFHMLSKETKQKTKYYIEKANKNLNKAIQIDSKDTFSLNNMGVILLDQGKYEEADKCFKNALRIDPDYELALFNKGRLLLSKGKTEEAKRCFNRVLKLSPCVLNYIIAAWMYELRNIGTMSLEDYKKFDSHKRIEIFEKTGQICDEILKLDSNFKEALLLKGKFLAEYKGEIDEGLTYINSALDIDPNYVEALYTKGVILDELKGEKSKSLICFKKALDINPEYIAFIWSANVKISENIPSSLKIALKSKGMLDDKGIVDPNYYQSYYYHTIASFNVNVCANEDEAISYYDRALCNDPNDIDALVMKGAMLTFQKKYKEAMECYNKALDINSKSFHALLNKGLSLTHQEQYKEALTCFEEIIKLQPNDEYEKRCYEEAKKYKESCLKELKN